MKRLITEKLLDWKNNKDRKPLIVYGARQIGKTFSILEFAKENYDNLIMCNFENNEPLKEIFTKNLDAKRIILELEALYSQKISKNTLIFFDEIQACEQALTSLKYFNENAPEYNIICAGSLLGIAINRGHYSFPVGKVDMLNMYPMNFKEFLLATNNEALLTMIEDSYEKDTPLVKVLHNKAIDLYKTYLIVGGMPNAVMEYINKKDFDYVRVAQNNIFNAYVSDMSKYSTQNDTIKTMAVYDSIPSQLAKENKKFQYNLIKSGARATAYENSLVWLDKAGLVLKCTKAKEGKLPLEFYKDALSYKVYMSDVGLLSAKSNIKSALILTEKNFGGEAKGALTENYVAQELTANEIKLYYWESNNTAELDFLLELDNQIIPIECKSAENVKAKSLTVFNSKYNITKSIRISTKNFGFENNIKSVPLYAVFCIKN